MVKKGLKQSPVHALVFAMALGYCIGCAHQHGLNTAKQSDAITLGISFPSTEVDSHQFLSGFLILSNGSPKSIRYTTYGTFRHSIEPEGKFTFKWFPGHFDTVPPSLEQIAETVQTLQSCKSIAVPVQLWVGTNKTIHVQAEYDVFDEDVRRLGILTNSLVAEPITIQLP